MRVKHVVGGVLALACVCLPSIEASRWTNKKRRTEEEKQADSVNDPFLGITRKQPRNPAATAAGGGFTMDDLTSRLGSGAGNFDMTAVFKEIVDTSVEMLEEAKRSDMSKENMIALLRDLPTDAAGSLPGLEDGVSAVIASLDEVDGEELQQTMDRVIDPLLENLKGVQQQLSEPDGLQKLIHSNLQAAGLSDDEIEKVQKLLGDPAALMDAVQQVADTFKDMDLSEEDYAQLQQALADPDALSNAMDELLNDEDLKDAFEGADMESLFADWASDPEVQAALEGAKSGSKRGSKRTAEDTIKRTARRQRA